MMMVCKLKQTYQLNLQLLIVKFQHHAIPIDSTNNRQLYLQAKYEIQVLYLLLLQLVHILM